jgi:pilus assembly protein CpaE
MLNLRKTEKPASPRILAVGDAAPALAQGAWADATIEVGGLDRLPTARAGVFDLVLIDADAWEAAALSAAVEALAKGGPPPVLLTGARLPTSVIRNLMRLPHSDVLEAPFAADQFAAAAAGLMQTTAPAPVLAAPVRGSRCWAVTGAVGGAGATTLAVEMASALAERAGADRAVCLIDLNLADGAAAAYLGTKPMMRLGDLPGPERIDAALLQAFVSPVSKRLDLLAGVREPGAFDAVGREAVLRVLEVACETYQFVVLDMPRHRRTWTLEAMSGCDEVLVVSELTVPALLAARSLADEIGAAVDSGPTPRIVLNRLASRMFGPAPSMAEAERALGRKADAGISSDWEAAAASVNLGGPIAQHRPKSKIVKDVQALVEQLVGETGARRAA